MKKCHECGTEMLDNVLSCPQCGAPMPQSHTPSNGSVVKSDASTGNIGDNQIFVILPLIASVLFVVGALVFMITAFVNGVFIFAGIVLFIASVANLISSLPKFINFISKTTF